MHWIISAWTVVLVVVMALLLQMVGDSIQFYGQFLRGHLGEVAGGAVGGLTLAPWPMLVWVAGALLLNRQFGIRCSHCHRSLTGRCLPSRVVQSGECCHCHTRVFDETQVA
jgi:hypothetical protein